MDSNTKNDQAWQVIVNQSEEIRLLRRRKFFGLIKPCLLAWGMGVVTPLFFQFVIIWFLPAPVRETYTIISAWWNDVTLGVQCSAREFTRKK